MMARLLQNKYRLHVQLLQTRYDLQGYSKAFSINTAHIYSYPNVCNRMKYSKLLYKADSQTIRRRMFYSLFKKPTIKELQSSDKIPPQFVLIYNNRMKNYLLYGHFTVYICFALFVMVAIVKNGPSGSLRNRKEENTIRHFGNDQFVFSSVLIIFIVTLQALILRMPIRIYNDPKTNKYAFIYYGLIPNNKKILLCKLADIVKQEEKGLLPWRDSRFIIKEKENAILIHEFFRTPSDLNIILRYEKPPNNEES